MQFSRIEHEQFLDLELKEQTRQYVIKIQTSALALIEKDEVFSTQFVKMENGELILKFKNDRGIPRKGEYLTAVILVDEKRSYKTWGNISWADLRRNYQIEYTEVVCVWHSGISNSNFSIAGFRGVSLDFESKLVEKCIVILGPKEPPYQYIQNLIKIVRNLPQNHLAAKFLDVNLASNNWEPVKLNNDVTIKDLILNQLAVSNETIIQGPPGTGKTHLMGEISASLLSKSKSILVTALTNRALIELALKPALKTYLEAGKVHKTNLTTDEKNEVPKLLYSKEIICSPNNLSLATFYTVSGLASQIPSTPPFDYVIMDEASQGLLSMFAAIKLLGKNIICVGDPYQLPPVVLLNNEIIKKKLLHHLIRGMTTICNNHSIASFQLTKSYRLTKRSTKYTGVFYNNSLVSCSPLDYNLKYSSLNYEIGKFLNPEGGPTLIKTTLPKGDATPNFGIQLIKEFINYLINLNAESVEISVLSKLKRTVKTIQKEVSNNIGVKKNLLIETVERVQGLTNDITIFFIPNTMEDLSLEKSLFNVATSRAKGHTLIIMDKDTLNYPYMDKDVKKYLDKLNLDFSFQIEPIINNGMLNSAE